jgi:hypothetical protein
MAAIVKHVLHERPLLPRRRNTVETAKIAEKPRCRGTKILGKEERPSCHSPVIVPWIPDRKIDWIY